MAIELCEFLSDIKHPENHELVSSTILQLDKERHQACSEHNHHIFEENQITYEAIQRQNQELLLAKVESIHNQIEERNKQIQMEHWQKIRLMICQNKTVIVR